MKNRSLLFQKSRTGVAVTWCWCVLTSVVHSRLHSAVRSRCN